MSRVVAGQNKFTLCGSKLAAPPSGEAGGVSPLKKKAACSFAASGDRMLSRKTTKSLAALLKKRKFWDAPVCLGPDRLDCCIASSEQWRTFSFRLTLTPRSQAVLIRQDALRLVTQWLVF